jgi:hypothetical protein
MPPDDAIVKSEDRFFFEYVFSEDYLSRNEYWYCLRLIRKFRAGWGGYIISPSLREAVLALGALELDSASYVESVEEHWHNCRQILMRAEATNLSDADVLAAAILSRMASTENERRIHANGISVMLGLLNSSTRGEHQSQGQFALFRPLYSDFLVDCWLSRVFGYSDDLIETRLVQQAPSLIDYCSVFAALGYGRTVVENLLYALGREFRTMFGLLSMRLMNGMGRGKLSDAVLAWIKQRKKELKLFQLRFEKTIGHPIAIELEHDKELLREHVQGSCTCLCLSLLYLLLETDSFQNSLFSPEGTTAGLKALKYIFAIERLLEHNPSILYPPFVNALLFLGGQLHNQE